MTAYYWDNGHADESYESIIRSCSHDQMDEVMIRAGFDDDGMTSVHAMLDEMIASGLHGVDEQACHRVLASIIMFHECWSPREYGIIMGMLHTACQPHPRNALDDRTRRAFGFDGGKPLLDYLHHRKAGNNLHNWVMHAVGSHGRIIIRMNADDRDMNADDRAEAFIKAYRDDGYYRIMGGLDRITNRMLGVSLSMYADGSLQSLRMLPSSYTRFTGTEESKAFLFREDDTMDVRNAKIDFINALMHAPDWKQSFCKPVQYIQKTGSMGLFHDDDLPSDMDDVLLRIWNRLTAWLTDDASSAPVIADDSPALSFLTKHPWENGSNMQSCVFDYLRGIMDHASSSGVMIDGYDDFIMLLGIRDMLCESIRRDGDPSYFASSLSTQHDRMHAMRTFMGYLEYPMEFAVQSTLMECQSAMTSG